MQTRMRSKTKVLVLLVSLAALHAAIVFAGFFAPYDGTEQDRELPYAPPTRLHFAGVPGFHFRPFVYQLLPGVDGYTVDSVHEYPVHWCVRGRGYTVLGIFKSDLHLFGVDKPARIVLVGTDGFGRDEFSRLLYGGQISLIAG